MLVRGEIDEMELDSFVEDMADGERRKWQREELLEEEWVIVEE